MMNIVGHVDRKQQTFFCRAQPDFGGEIPNPLPQQVLPGRIGRKQFVELFPPVENEIRGTTRDRAARNLRRDADGSGHPAEGGILNSGVPMYLLGRLL